MEENNNNQQPQLQLDLKPEVAAGIYSNLALITHGHSEFVLDFLRMLPGMPKPEVASRIVTTPEHAKRLLLALQDNIVKYEQMFGQIQLPEQTQRTVAPFTSGEA